MTGRASALTNTKSHLKFLTWNYFPLVFKSYILNST